MSPTQLLQYLAIIFLFFFMVVCVVVAGFDIAQNITPPPAIYTIIGTGVGYAMTAAGIQHGSMIAQQATDNAIHATANMTVSPGN